MTTTNKTAEVLADLSVSFRASLPCAAVQLPSPADEDRIIELLVREVAEPSNLKPFLWDVDRGLCNIRFDDSGIEYEPEQALNILEVLAWLTDQMKEPALLILADLHPYIVGEQKDPLYVRGLKNLAKGLQASDKRAILLSGKLSLPEDEFGGLIEEYEIPLPDASSVEEILSFGVGDIAVNYEDALAQARYNLQTLSNQTSDNLIETERQCQALQSRIQQLEKFTTEPIEGDSGARLVRSCQGLSEQEILKSLRKASIKFGRLSCAEMADFINERKLAKLRKLGVELLQPPDTEIGGLNNLKNWFKQRTKLFNAQTANSHIPSPKGILLVGPQGTGKSLTAKAIGQLWSVPILRFDMGSMFNSLVGESEANMRRLLATAESIAPVVLLVDEIDKAFAGASGPSTDSGVGQRLFGYFLTWMQEKKSPAFVVATANRIDHLPPELVRKGRFDEIFFIDLPQQQERLQILQIHCQRFEIELTDSELESLAVATSDFSGAELEALVKDAAIAGFGDDRSPELADFKLLLQEVKPQAHQYPERLVALREWAKSVRPATLPEELPPAASNGSAPKGRKAKMLL